MAQQHLDRLTAVDASFLAPGGRRARTCTSARSASSRARRPSYADLLDHLRGAPAPRPALPPEARRSRASRRAGRCGSTTRTSTSSTTCATPRCRAPGSEEQLRASTARIFSQQLDRSKPLWEIWLVQGLEGNRFALISKTHHALVDGISGVDLATVLFDLDAGARSRSSTPARAWTPAPEPRRGAARRRGASRARAHAASSSPARGADARPRARTRALADAREAAEGVGEIVWAGLNPAPPTPLNVADRPAPALRVRAPRARGLQDASRTRSAARSTTSC